MVEPARNLPGNVDSDPPGGRHLHSVPDDEEILDGEENPESPPQAKPDLKSIDGGGETTPGRADLHEAGEGDWDTSVGKSKKGKGKIRGKITRRRAAMFAGGGLAAGIIGFLMFVLPGLRLQGYLASIDDRVMAGASNAVEKRLENLTTRYLFSRIDDIQRCGNVISGNCKRDYRKYGIAADLFTTWRDAKIEDKLFKEMGIKIEYNKNGPKGHRYRILDKDGQEITISEGERASGKFEGGRRELGNELERLMKNETHWRQVMFRKSVRKMGARKYDMKFWCYLVCRQKDDLEMKTKYGPKTRIKYQFVKRFVYPFSVKYGIILDCIIDYSHDKCSSEALRKQAVDRDLTPEEIKALEDDVGRYFEGGDKANQRFGTAIYDRIIERLIKNVTAKKALGTVPAFGQIYLALSLTDMFDQMDRHIKNGDLGKYYSELMTRWYAEYYIGNQSAVGEVKAGDDTAAEVQALYNQFGGEHPAETSRIYQAYNNPGVSLQQIANTEKNDANPYVCKDGKPIPDNQYVCPEKMIVHKFKIEELRQNGIVNNMADILNKYSCMVKLPLIGCKGPQFIVHPALRIFNDILSKTVTPVAKALIDRVLSVLSYIPGVRSFLDLMKHYMHAFIQVFMSKLFPLPGGIDSFGRELYDGLEGGGEVVASEFNKGGVTPEGLTYGLGAHRQTSTEAAAAATAYAQSEQNDYEHTSLWSKATNITYPNAFGTRLVNAAPMSVGSFFSDLGNALMKPFSSLFFTTGHATAGGAVMPNSAFGIERDGYNANDPVFQADPAKYTKSYCDNMMKKWLASQKEDKVTGIEYYTMDNPCLLEQATVEAGAAALNQNDSLDDDVFGTGPGTITSTTTTPFNPGSVPSGTSQALALALLQNHYKGSINGHSYSGDGKYNCANSGDCSDLDNVAHGVSLIGTGQGTCRVPTLDPKVLQILTVLIEGQGFSIGTFALCSDHPSNADASRHTTAGAAVDIAVINGVAVNNSGAKADTVKLMKFLNSLVGNDLAPDQVLCHGNGRQDDDVDNLEMNNHQVSPKYQVSDHTDHIHVGY